MNKQIGFARIYITSQRSREGEKREKANVAFSYFRVMLKFRKNPFT